MIFEDHAIWNIFLVQWQRSWKCDGSYDTIIKLANMNSLDKRDLTLHLFSSTILEKFLRYKRISVYRFNNSHRIIFSFGTFSKALTSDNTWQCTTIIPQLNIFRRNFLMTQNKSGFGCIWHHQSFSILDWMICHFHRFNINRWQCAIHFI